MPQNWKFHHISVIVRDMSKATEYYQSLGIGPFPPLIGPEGTVTLTEKKVRDKPVDYQIDLRQAEVGGLNLEVIQPLEGDTPVKEFLEKKGEGIQHIGFFVDDLDQETAKLAEKGFTITQSGESPEVKWAYYDTDKIGGVSIELMQQK
jgi:catechol 2,3-dioxygenase-like lactoylglutathione lyase family enzyme